MVSVVKEKLLKGILKFLDWVMEKCNDFEMLSQPSDKTCGQTCVAFIAAVSVDDVVKVVGTDKGTHGTDLIRALKFLDIACSDKLIRISRNKQKPKYCIVRIHWPNDEGGHWVVFRKGRYYDPGDGVIKTYEEIVSDYEGVRETSYIEIHKSIY